MMPDLKAENTDLTLPISLENGSTRAATPAFRLDLLRSLRMHPVLAASITGVSFVLLLLYGSTIKPVYEAEALVHVQPEPITLLDESPKPAFDPGKYDSFLQEQIQCMQRPATISAALDRLPRSVWAEYGSSKEKATERILAKLKVARVSTSYQVSLVLKGSDPANVTAVINAITYTYLDLVHKEIHIENEERAVLLAEEGQRIANELRRDQDEQSALGTSLGLANPDGVGDPYEGELAALREQLVQARSAHAAAAARMASLKGKPEELGSALTAEADEAILGDPGLSALKSSISERRAILRGQMSGMTADNPLRRRDQDELTELDRSLEEMTTKLRLKSERDLQEKFGANLQRTGDLEIRINSQLAQRTAAATKSTPKLQRATELNGDIKRLLTRQSEIENAARSLQLEVNSPGAVRLTLAAEIPSSPEGNHKHLFLMASFPLALALGAVAAAITRKRDPRLYTGQDVGDTLGFLPLVTLPVNNEVTEAVIAENLLRLSGAVASAHRVKGFRTFLFTTVSVPSDIEPLSRMLLETLRETGINACSISAADLLLPVDANQRLESKNVRSPEVNNFPIEQVGPQAFAERNLALLQARHSLILVKASQPFRCGETEYIARCTDATILVVESAVTTKVELICATESAHRLRVPGIGVVLQDVRRPHFADAARELLAVRNTPDVLRETSLQEQAPLLKQGDVKTSVVSKNGTEPSTQPTKDQATQTSHAANIVSAAEDPDLRTSKQKELRASAPLPSRAQSIEDTPGLNQKTCQFEELITAPDEAGIGGKTQLSTAINSGYSDHLARVELEEKGTSDKQSLVTKYQASQTLPEDVPEFPISAPVLEKDLAPLGKAGILVGPVSSVTAAAEVELSQESIGDRKVYPITSSEMERAMVRIETPGVKPEGECLEIGQSKSGGVYCPANAKDTGFDEMQYRFGGPDFALLSEHSEEREEQQNSKALRHSLLSGLPHSFGGGAREGRLGNCPALLKEECSNAVPSIVSVQPELLEDFGHSSTLQRHRLEGPSSALQLDNLAGQEDVLTRQWRLLSRFQQKGSLLSDLAQNCTTVEQGRKEL